MKERWQQQWFELDTSPGLKRTWFVIKIIAEDVSSLRGLVVFVPDQQVVLWDHRISCVYFCSCNEII